MGGTSATKRPTSDAPRSGGADVAAAGFLMLSVNLLCAGVGAGIGALVGALVPLLLVGFFVGFGLAIYVVAGRFRTR
jgi:hypothetical protein